MNYTAKIELDLNGEDVLEKETLNAVRAYAKSIARSVMHEEVEKEIDRIAKTYVESLYKKNTWSESAIERMIKQSATELIKRDLGQKQIKEIATESVSNLFADEWAKLLQSGYIADIIRSVAEDDLPKIVLDALKKKK